MIINHNLSAINAQRQFKLDTFNMDKTAEKLASGMRINRAGDDAAGLAVSEKMRSQIRGLNQASKNAQDGISFIQTAEGWLNETTTILQRMRELSVQSANGIYTREDRLQIQVEIEELVDEVDRIASQAEFNNLRLFRGGWRRATPEAPLAPIQGVPAEKQVPIIQNAEADPVQNDIYNAGNPDFKGGIIFHIGSNINQREVVYLENMSAWSLGIAKAGGEKGRVSSIDLTTQSTSNQAIERLDAAINVVSKQRADLGAYQNRLEDAVRGIDYAAENLQASESRIRDSDMAKEMVNFVKEQILTQSAASILAQANVRPQMVMRILG